MCGALGCAAVLYGLLRTRQHLRGAAGPSPRYDAVVVPGGGLRADGRPTAWVGARLDAALAHEKETSYFLVLSRGTTHKPPPVDARGYAIDEASASGAYLIHGGVAPERVLLESWSLDTIGNAAFARLMHSDARRWRRLHVVTSAFHMARTREIFDWVFGLPPHAARQPQISYEAVDEAGLDPEALAGRIEKERRSLDGFRSNVVPRVADLAALHRFLFTEHDAYRAHARGSELGTAAAPTSSHPALGTY